MLHKSQGGNFIVSDTKYTEQLLQHAK